MIGFRRWISFLPLLLISISAQLQADAPPSPWSHFTLSGNGPSLNSTPVVYDPGSNRLIVFGGEGTDPCCSGLNDTWILTNANGVGGPPEWQQLSPSGPLPPGRGAHSAVYDQLNNRLIVFGGGVLVTGPYSVRYNDVWVLSNANGLGGTPTWNHLVPVGTLPAPRVAAGAVYDPNSNRMTIFGGGDNGFDATNDTWVLTNANGLGGTPEWVQLAPTGDLPAPREVFVYTYDPSTNAMTIFGGCCGFMGDLWILANANGIGTPSWQQITQTSPAPGTRASWNSGYDPETNSLLFFGAGPSFGVYSNDVWVLKNANGVGTPTWANTIPNGAPGSPPAAGVFLGAFDPVRKRFMVVPDAGDLWVLDATASLGGNGVSGIDLSQLPADWTPIVSQYDPAVIVAAAWGGRGPYIPQASQILSSAPAGSETAAYCLLNYDDATTAGYQNPGAYQVGQALAAVGSSTQQAALAFMSIDVERICAKGVCESLPSDSVQDRNMRIYQAVQAVQSANLTPIIYTTRDLWPLITGGTTGTTSFGCLPLWDAHLDGVADVLNDGPGIAPPVPLSNVTTTPWLPYGGWTARAGKQYVQNTPDSVDLDVFSPAMFSGGVSRMAFDESSSNNVAVSRSGFHLNQGTHQYVQTVTITNTSAGSIPGPVSLALDNLSATATLIGVNGATSCTFPAGSSFLNVQQAALQPGQSVTAILQFSNPTNQGIGYTPRILAGSGSR